MSYILEALKKAQAERQLGDTPTIHAPVLDAPVERHAPLRKPLVGVVAVMGVVIAALGAVVWRQAAAPAPVTAPSTPVPVPALPAAVQVAATPQPAQIAVAPADSAAAPAPAKPVPVPTPAARVTPAAPPPPAVPVTPAPPPATVAKAPAPAAPVPVPQADEPARAEPVQALRDLPEPIRRAIPPVAMSGYMYSSNPADRLILIDKVLRREGDEVAPGLVLERLEAKGAVFAFRGYRYRMPY